MTNTRSLALVAAMATLTLGACAQPNMINNPGDNSRRNAGAAAGAALGGLVAGPVTGGGTGRTVAGAAAGAALGGVIGARLDRQAAELRNSLGDGISVNNQGNQLLVTFPQDILFETDSTQVGFQAQNELQRLASNLQQYPDTNVQVIGHTDNTGSANYNFNLSQRRASAVSSILVNSGVSPGRVNSVGRGEDQPVASNLDASGRAQNRRVEVVIQPTQQAIQQAQAQGY